MRNILQISVVVGVGVAVAVNLFAEYDAPSKDRAHQLEQKWCYRSAGYASTNYASLGKAGQFVSYTLSTPDKIETVVRWYGEKIGLSQDHALMLAADSGFASLGKDLHGDYHVYNDTDNSRGVALVTANAAPSHAHITFYYRPDYTSDQYISISVSRTAKGASIAVLFPKPRA